MADRDTRSVTLEEVGKQFEVTPERIQQIEALRSDVAEKIGNRAAVLHIRDVQAPSNQKLFFLVFLNLSSATEKEVGSPNFIGRVSALPQGNSPDIRDGLNFAFDIRLDVRDLLLKQKELDVTLLPTTRTHATIKQISINFGEP